MESRVDRAGNTLGIALMTGLWSPGGTALGTDSKITYTETLRRRFRKRRRKATALSKQCVDRDALARYCVFAITKEDGVWISKSVLI